MNELHAHTPNAQGEWHLLRDHLCDVSELAGVFAAAFDARDLALCLGLLHDFGKASNEFQRYLNLCAEAQRNDTKPPSKSVDHKLAGAGYAVAFGSLEQQLAIPILGHHGGMEDPSAVRARTAETHTNEQTEALARALSLMAGKLEHPSIGQPWASSARSIELLLRMLFSCLVDADYLDTEQHWEPLKSATRDSSYAISDLWRRFEINQKQLLQVAAPTQVNELRRGIYESCVTAADGPPGVYRLTVPTGGGKTRSAMAFALKHAITHNLDRIIVAIPYTSIIDQNAREYRTILGADNVLEHHSSMRLPEDENCTEDQLRAQLASENWDAPVVVTTTIQLFESLFSNKPSKCRKLHRIARSVIVLDEVQTLPIGLVQPILDVLKELVANSMLRWS